MCPASGQDKPWRGPPEWPVQAEIAVDLVGSLWYLVAAFTVVFIPLAASDG